VNVTNQTTDDRQYHHGNLRRALMDEALRVIDEEGPPAVSLRELARRIGVSHAAPAHHFADKTALFTAIAVEGQALLADLMEQAETFRECGLAYVRFAVDHPARIRVIFQPSLYDTEDAGLNVARERCFAALFDKASRTMPDADPAQVGLAGWCLMHGLAALWQGDNLAQFGDDPMALANWIADVTF
jgi:AcrR family transcriptional regulator